MFNLTFNKIKTYINKLIDVLIPIILVSLLLGIIFGPDAPFVGSIYTNVSNVMSMLGEDGLLALVSIIIILSYLKKN
jgi:hypothetical protein